MHVRSLVFVTIATWGLSLFSNRFLSGTLFPVEFSVRLVASFLILADAGLSFSCFVVRWGDYISVLGFFVRDILIILKTFCYDVNFFGEELLGKLS